MKVIQADCIKCGAPLDVRSGARSVACTFCGAAVTVVSAAAGRPHDKLEELEKELALSRRDRAIDQLDQEWRETRERLLVRDKHGSAHLPTTATAVATMVIGGVFGILWTVFAAPAGAFALFGLVFAAVAVVMGIIHLGKIRRYEDARSSYQRRRRRLMEAAEEAS